MVGGMPALSRTCRCTCSWGGTIRINFPGQVETRVA